MALRNIRQVIAEADKLAGRATGHAFSAYEKQTLGPLLKMLARAKSPRDARRKLSRKLLDSMDMSGTVDVMTKAAVTAHLNGRVAARPAGFQGSNEATKRRSDEG